MFYRINKRTLGLLGIVWQNRCTSLKHLTINVHLLTRLGFSSLASLRGYKTAAYQFSAELPFSNMSQQQEGACQNREEQVDGRAANGYVGIQGSSGISDMNACEENRNYDYDLLVIGGGSGGMAAAKEAARLGRSVCLFDYVRPSSRGTTWGIGGTCVNVGCVPKKLMHYAGSIGSIIHHDSKKYGWLDVSTTHAWPNLVQTVQNHVKMLCFSYRNSLRLNKVEYINAKAVLKDSHTVSYRIKSEEKEVRGRYIIISVGGRPSIPDVPGAKELAITSDDIFCLHQDPGTVLVVGGSYIALECAGFLTELGYSVTVAVRSILLRGFDRQCADKVGSLMAELGTKFLYGIVPKKLEKLDTGKIKVTFEGSEDQEFDTVLYATGRQADTANLGLEAAGVIVRPDGKIETKCEQTNVPNIFAIGDCIYGKPELTPVAIKAGELLVRRIFSGSNKQMDYDLVPTTVFTPVEYGCCGLSEEEAIRRFGLDNIETYLSEFTSLEIGASHREKCTSSWSNEFDCYLSPCCLSKLVCLKIKDGNLTKEKVVGFHFIGPHASEVTQGMALALRLGATKEDFDNCLGIHPTDAESFMGLTISRSSGQSWVATGGCGGGKCG